MERNTTRGLSIGAGAGCCAGAMFGIYHGTSLATPVVFGGGVGALSFGSYYSIWQWMRSRSAADNPVNHVVAGSITGYAMTVLAAGPKATKFGIIGGGSSGVVIFLALTGFERWRVKTGIEMARAKAVESSASNSMSQDVQTTKVNQGGPIFSHTAENKKEQNQASNEAGAHQSGWYSWLPIRKISDDEAKEILEERKRVQEIRLVRTLLRCSCAPTPPPAFLTFASCHSTPPHAPPRSLMNPIEMPARPAAASLRAQRHLRPRHIGVSSLLPAGSGCS